MKYGITRLVLGCSQFIELSKAEYEAAKKAKISLVTTMCLEEKLYLVLENYVELELELLKRATRNLVFSDNDSSIFMDDLFAFNRRLANLLFAIRLYIDQTKHDVSKLFGADSMQFKETARAFAEQYDTYIGYRVLEAIRNHMQHRSLPVYMLKRSFVRDAREQVTLGKVTIIPYMRVSSIEEEGCFKPQVLQELKKGDDLVDFRPFVRQYVASIGEVHKGLRKRMEDAVASWDAEIESIREKFRDVYDDQLAGLAIVMKDDQGAVVESFDIIERIVIRRKALEMKIRNVSHLATIYVSSEAPVHSQCDPKKTS